MTGPGPRRSGLMGVTLPLRRPIRLHRRPAVDALLLVLAVALAFVLLRSAVAHPERVVIASDSALFDAPAALYNTGLLADSFLTRVTGSANGQAAAAWITARFEQLGLVVEQEKFPMALRGREVSGTNVLARSAGRSRGVILLLAHFDGPTTSGQSAGASASGIGALIELARVLESRPHRHPYAYAAVDAGSWGQVGAAHLPGTFPDSEPVVAAISIDHVANGPAIGVAIGGVGQGPGYAPLWLRAGAADALAYDGNSVEDVGPLTEWYLRTIRLSETDQGPLVSRGIPAVNLGTIPARPEYASFLLHTPGDRVETLDTAAFRMLGAGVERLVRSIDRGEDLTGPFTYLRVGADRMVRGVAILLAAIALFLPLLFASFEAARAATVDPAARTALRSELARAVSWWVIAAVGLLALRGLVAAGLLPRFEIYPATERDPWLYDVRWGPMVVVLLAMLAAALGLAQLRRRLRLAVGHPFAGRAVALGTLVVVAVIALVLNPFAAVWLLALPAWLWPWIGPTRRSLTGAASTVLVVVSAVPAVVIGVLIGRQFELGVRTGWYLFLQAAYGAWSPLTCVMALVVLLAAVRLTGTATSRLLPDAGD